MVIIPEGKRNIEQITRFHKGAFYMAQEIGCDILPIFIHGAGHVMPKGSGLTARGQITVEIGKRVTASELTKFGDTHLQIANSFHKLYINHFSEMRKEIETTHYFHNYIIDKYTYKGIGIERETRQMLKKHDDCSKWIDNYIPQDNTKPVAIINSRCGQFALLFAMVHPDIEVHSYSLDAEEAALAKACAPLPCNLRIDYCESVEKAREQSADCNIIDLTIFPDNKQ